MNPEHLKEDKNFLEYPNWVLDKKNEVKNFIIQKKQGRFEIKTTADRLPDRTDKLILYYFLSLVFQNNFKNNLSLTRYQIVKNVFDCKGVPYYYQRVLTSIQRWHEIAIKFDGIFFDGENYTTRGFHIIESYSFDHKTGEVKIKFNSDYLAQLKQSDYYQIINFNKIKRLKRDVSFMLYELLIKQKLPWKIKLKTLGKILTLKRVYDSQIILKLTPAINEINKNTELNISFSTIKNNSDETIAVFNAGKAISNEITIQLPKEIEEFIPLKHKTEKIRELIQYYLNEGYEKEYIQSNIQYSNQNAAKNYLQYLVSALDQDYAKQFRDTIEIQQKAEQEKQKQILEKKAEQLQLQEFIIKSQDFISSLDEEKYKNFEKIAIEELIKEWKARGFHEIAVPEKLPKVCIKQKIYELFGKKD